MNHPMFITDLTVVLLAEGPKNTGPDFGKASPVGLFIIVLLLIAVFALVWSMNRHLKKARDHFDAAGADGVEQAPAATAPSDGAAPAPTREPSGESGG